MTHAVFDHLVVAADSLARGVAHVEHALGLRCSPGGQHPRMGTHNALLGLGPGRYIEVIAIDPEAVAPDTPRWFALDDPDVQAALRERPRLLTWVARTSDLDATLAAAHHDTGPPRAMERGDLAWRIGFPADGRLVDGGLVPPLIEWGAGMRHPAERLPDTGAELLGLHAIHPRPAQVRARLEPLGLGDALSLSAGASDSGAHLRAEIRTPEGTRWLE